MPRRNLRYYFTAKPRNNTYAGSVEVRGSIPLSSTTIKNEKLKVFDDEIEARNKVALRYNEFLNDIVTTPTIRAEKHNVWAQYTIKTPLREQLKAALKEAGIPTAIYYRSSLTQQPAYEDFPITPTGVRTSNTAAAEVLSLPMHAYLSETLQDRIIDEIKAFFDPIVGRNIE